MKSSLTKTGMQGSGMCPAEGHALERCMLSPRESFVPSVVGRLEATGHTCAVLAWERLCVSRTVA